MLFMLLEGFLMCVFSYVFFLRPKERGEEGHRVRGGREGRSEAGECSEECQEKEGWQEEQKQGQGEG